MGFKNKKIDTRVAKTAPAKDFEDESVKNAEQDVRRRLTGNSRDLSNRFFTSMLNTTPNNQKKQTLG